MKQVLLGAGLILLIAIFVGGFYVHMKYEEGKKCRALVACATLGGAVCQVTPKDLEPLDYCEKIKVHPGF